MVGPIVCLAMLMSGSAFAEPSAPRHAPRIGVSVFGPATLPVELRIRLEDAAAAGLKASGAEVVSAAELARARASSALGTCSDSLCERRLAQVTDTRYWLRGTVQQDTSTYRLHLELTDARSGAVVVARDDTCDICTDADAAETVNVAASALKAALGRTPGHGGSAARAPAAGSQVRPPRPSVSASGGGPPAAPGMAAARPAAGSAATGGTEGAGDAQEQRPGRPAWRRLLPWAALVGAAGAGVAGGIYLAVDGDGFYCRGEAENCHRYNDSAWSRGVPWLAISAVLATTGVVLLTMGDRQQAPEARASARRHRPRRPAAKVLAWPGGVSLHGSF